MKILVCIAKTPDTTSKIAFEAGETKLVEGGMTWIINPYDEWYSLVRAIELLEQGIATNVTLISVGDSEFDPIIRKAFALGGESAVRIDNSSSDPMVVAKEIAAYAKQNNFDLVLAGKESIDYNNASVAGMIAEAMDANFVAQASKLDIDGQVLTLEREIEGGTETVKMQMPAVVSTMKGMAEQRIPNMRGIMAARTKTLTVIPASVTENYTEIVKFEMPPSKKGVQLISADQVTELVERLHSEAKVI